MDDSTEYIHILVNDDFPYAGMIIEAFIFEEHFPGPVSKLTDLQFYQIKPANQLLHNNSAKRSNSAVLSEPRPQSFHVCIELIQNIIP